jgi:hypothetical protein
MRKIVANDICSQSANIKNLYAENEVVNNLCATTANITNACISNLTLGGNFIPQMKYRATVNYAADTTYTLGSFLNFANIVDDPNNNISLSPTTYTAPISGYYMMTYKVNVTNVVSTNGPILGIPVANPEIYVNGLLVREAYSPFLSFFSDQKVIVDSLITLQQGDQLTMKYNILAGNGNQVAGTVDIIGAGIEDGNSLFKIILLSGISNSGQPPVCASCPIVQTPCEKLSDCDNETSHECIPCRL